MKLRRKAKVSFEKFGIITIDEIREHAPEGASLYLHGGDGYLDHKIIYYRLDVEGKLTFHADSEDIWLPCQNPKIVPQLKLLLD